MSNKETDNLLSQYADSSTRSNPPTLETSVESLIVSRGYGARISKTRLEWAVTRTDSGSHGFFCDGYSFRERVASGRVFKWPNGEARAEKKAAKALEVYNKTQTGK